MVVSFEGCDNPFAPALELNPVSSASALSDLKTTDGVFQNFQYAYTFRDTTIYGQLISSNFVFTYTDYDLGYNVSWGRDDEMKTTYGLFQNAQQLNLVWNGIVLSTSDSSTAEIVRGFNLTITFSSTDVISLEGRVDMSFIKNPNTGKWQISEWIDETNF
jgi:hypothetical protein